MKILLTILFVLISFNAYAFTINYAPNCKLENPICVTIPEPKICVCNKLICEVRAYCDYVVIDFDKVIKSTSCCSCPDKSDCDENTN